VNQKEASGEVLKAKLATDPRFKEESSHPEDRPVRRPRELSGVVLASYRQRLVTAVEKIAVERHKEGKPRDEIIAEIMTTADNNRGNLQVEFIFEPYRLERYQRWLVESIVDLVVANQRGCAITDLLLGRTVPPFRAYLLPGEIPTPIGSAPPAEGGGA